MSNYENSNEETSSTEKWTDIGITWLAKWIAMPLLEIIGFGLIGIAVRGMYIDTSWVPPLLVLGTGIFLVGIGVWCFFAPRYTTVVDPKEKTITVTSSRGYLKIIHFSDIVKTSLASNGKGIVGIQLYLANGKKTIIFLGSRGNLRKTLKRLDLILSNSK